MEKYHIRNSSTFGLQKDCNCLIRNELIIRISGRIHFILYDKCLTCFATACLITRRSTLHRVTGKVQKSPKSWLFLKTLIDGHGYKKTLAEIMSLEPSQLILKVQTPR